MRFSKKSEYGLRAIINLGIAHELGRERVTAGELAAADNLPHKFLEQIFLKFREAGYIDTQRGKHGGYFITKDPKTIRIGALIRLLDGPLAPISCASVSAYEPCSCTDEAHCGLRMLMIDVRNTLSGILDKYTVHDVVSITLRKIQRDGVTHFFHANEKKVTKSKSRNPADPTEGFLAELTRRE
jgi:Rrf2 family protein